jgi:Predicted periplasmic lipoprotein (DUF2279)
LNTGNIKYLLLIILLMSLGNFAYSQLSLLNNDTGLKLKTKNFKLKTASNRLPLKEKKSDINYVKAISITGFTIGAGVWLHNYQRNSWWAGQRGQFHIQNDWDYSMSADKCGHFFDGYFIHNLYSGAFEWAGFDEKSAMWMGTLFSLAYMTDIEIEDGFATDWGFSPGDEFFNTLGAFYPVFQYYAKPLREFNFKWSYFPSDDLRNGNKQGAFLDDYNGQTLWLSIGVWKFMPKSVQKYWPDFFNIALGYGVKHYTDYANRYQDFYIALDFDYRKIIPGDSKFMLWVKDILNHFRLLPAPGIRINKHRVEYVINF